MRRSLVFGLRARNADVLTALDAAMIDREDEDHLATSAELGRALFSYNVPDYCVLHRKWLAQGRAHSGIVLAIQQRYSVGEELRRLMRLLSRVTAEQMRNRLEYRSSWS